MPWRLSDACTLLREMPNFFSIAHVDNPCFTYASSRNSFVSSVVICALYQTNDDQSRSTRTSTAMDKKTSPWSARDLFAETACLDITRKFLYNRGDRHGENDAEKACELGADDERQYNEERRDTKD